MASSPPQGMFCTGAGRATPPCQREGFLPPKPLDLAKDAGLLGTLLLHRISSSLLGPVDPSFRALAGRLKFTVRRHKFKIFSPSSLPPPKAELAFQFGVSGFELGLRRGLGE